MKRKVTPLILLIAALLCFLATAALHFNFPTVNPVTDQAAQLSTIVSRTNACIHKAQKDASQLSKYLKNERVSFSKLIKKTDYPTFIYQGDQLVFWSDHAVVPDLETLNHTSSITAVRSEYGSFIVVPYIFRNYHIYVCIPLKVNSRTQAELYPQLKDEVLKGISANLELDQATSFPVVHTPDNKFLFAVDFEGQQEQSRTKDLQLILLTFGSFFFVLFCFALLKHFGSKMQYGKGGAIFLILLVIYRLLLLVFDLPFSISEAELFDPRLYAASFWSPSVGDLALNMLLLATVAGIGLYLFRKNRVLAQLKIYSQDKAMSAMVWCMLGLYLLLAVLYLFYHSIYHNSPLVLDVTQSLNFTKYKIIIYAVMTIHTLALCMFTYTLSTVVTVLLQKVSKAWAYRTLLLITVLLIGILFFLQEELLTVILIGSGFWFIIILSAHSNRAVSFPYRTYLFFFLVVMVSAIVGAFALYTHYQNELKVYKQKLAFNLLQDNDVLGEYLLDDVSEKIASDALIQMKMMGPYVDASFIKRKITKQYLKDYFDKYETNVLLFDGRGQTLESADTTAATLQELLRKYDRPDTRTERPNLFLIKDPTRYNARTYFKLIQIPIGNFQRGTIVLQLTLKKMLPNSVVPELLVDQNYSKTFRTDMLSYAIYKKGKLWYSEGEYDYATNFNRKLIQQPELFGQGMSHGNFHHLGVKGNDGNILIITTEKYGGREVLSNFSFLFLAFTSGLILMGLFYLLVQRHKIREFSPNFSTKIQLFLNFGILLPLLLVSVTIAGLVTASYKKDLMTTYEQRGEAIQENLSRLLNDKMMESGKELRKKIADIAALSEADVNLYDRNGRLLVTSQPLIFETGLLSKLINPQAYAAISERQALRVLLQEQAGHLAFNAVYLPLRSEAKPNELIGFIGIPFFDSEQQLDLKLIELITTTMNIFTVMFIMFMVLTFFASRALTVPLRMLAGKLKHTSLTGKNEMLAYEGADEIGMLVNEYNRMLLTLEQNKEDLAMQEKEAAWREMARQVAHEIKNPLTPMKLSLQYLQKAIAEKKPNTEQLIEKISHTLITQINILSDIATSFSSFTSMPEPKQEQINISATLRKSVDLHNDPATAIVRTEFEVEEAIVVADENLMVRTFNNLLLNAIQAVPASRKPLIMIGLEIKPDHSVLITIKDNGSGIPQEIKGKVFIPNFSTKYTGSGIGLAVAKRGIENAGGRIWFESEEGKGTAFYISLPLANA
ncbi:ATP-binding protein [Pontibacter sp. MBLB2868]|uniref:ATP-binding protein n=1 Tax=Pontibacter sp. MBLB2868 TaxID=3451555 RepID=UPI003F75298E